MQKLDFLFERYPLFRYIPAILLLALLFRTSSIDGEGMSWLTEPYDKIVHGATYAFLGTFFALWFSNFHWKTKPCLYAVICVILCVIAGVLDEFHQSFVPGRSVSAGDVIADFIGGTIGVIIFVRVKPWQRFRIFKESEK